MGRIKIRTNYSRKMKRRNVFGDPSLKGGQKFIQIRQEVLGAQCIQQPQDKIRQYTFGFMTTRGFPEQISDYQLRKKVHFPFSYWIICKFIVCVKTPLPLKIPAANLQLLAP
jgi:hypothetical protein